MINHSEKILSLQDEKSKLNYLQSIEFETTISKLNGMITLKIDALNLKESGNNLDEVFQKLDEKKTKYFSEMISVGSEGEICFPPVKRPAGFKDLVVVAIDLLKEYKKLITFMIIFLVLLKSCSSVSRGIKKSKIRLNQKIHENLTETNPDKILKRQKRVQNFLNFIRPYHVQYERYKNEVQKEASLDKN